MRTINSLSDIEWVAVCDIYDVRREEAVKLTGGNTAGYLDYRELLEIRTILVPAGKPIILPVEYEGVLEVRTGSVATLVDGKREPHQRGEMWQVTKGSRVSLQASGELAVLRAIYLVPGEK